MFSNYLKVAIRNLFRNKFSSIINISGLALGMSIFVLLLLFIISELSYDRYHEKADRIYRFGTRGVFNDQPFEHIVTSAPMQNG